MPSDSASAGAASAAAPAQTSQQKDHGQTDPATVQHVNDAIAQYGDLTVKELIQKYVESEIARLTDASQMHLQQFREDLGLGDEGGSGSGAAAEGK